MTAVPFDFTPLLPASAPRRCGQVDDGIATPADVCRKEFGVPARSVNIGMKSRL